MLLGVPEFYDFLVLFHQNRKGLIGSDHHKHQQLLCIDGTDTETAGYTFLRSLPWWIECTVAHRNGIVSLSGNTIGSILIWMTETCLWDRTTPKSANPFPTGIPLLVRWWLSPAALQTCKTLIGLCRRSPITRHLSTQGTEVFKGVSVQLARSFLQQEPEKHILSSLGNQNCQVLWVGNPGQLAKQQVKEEISSKAKWESGKMWACCSPLLKWLYWRWG